MAKTAFKFRFSFLFLFLLFLSVSPKLVVAKSTHEKAKHCLNVDRISKALSDKGYLAMSMVLELALPTLIPFESTQATDQAVFSLRYSQPPLSLLQCHIAPSKITKEALESSIKPESKIDTLLQGHPLVLTTFPQRSITIDDVNIKDWAIYTDKNVIIHGIEQFFDPAFQTVENWFDDHVVKKDEDNNIWIRLEELFLGIKKLY